MKKIFIGAFFSAGLEIIGPENCLKGTIEGFENEESVKETNLKDLVCSGVLCS